MSDTEVYEAPNSSLELEVAKKPGVLVIVFAIIFSVPGAFINFAEQAFHGGMAAGIGGAFGSLIPALIVVGIFQLGKSYRNSASRCKIFMWSQFVFMIAQVAELFREIGAGVPQ